MHKNNNKYGADTYRDKVMELLLVILVALLAYLVKQLVWMTMLLWGKMGYDFESHQEFILYYCLSYLLFLIVIEIRT